MCDACKSDSATTISHAQNFMAFKKNATVSGVSAWTVLQHQVHLVTLLDDGVQRVHKRVLPMFRQDVNLSLDERNVAHQTLVSCFYFSRDAFDGDFTRYGLCRLFR